MSAKSSSERRNLAVAFGVATLLVATIALLLRFFQSTPAQRYTYKSEEHLDLTLDVYQPENGSRGIPRPCVIWFFGGAWEVGTPAQYSKISRSLTRLGIVVVTPDYRVRSRHGGDSTPFDSLDDAQDAVTWIRSHASELGVDPDRVAVGGGSSGGHLAVACAIFPSSGPAGSHPDALILFNPVVDFEIPFVRQRTSSAQREKLDEISPLARIERPIPPTLILHGTSDQIVPIKTSESFAAKALELGSERVELVRFPGEGHEFHLGGRPGSRGLRSAMSHIERFLTELGWVDSP